MDIETVADFECGCAEGPIWHPERQKLYFTDVDTPALFEFDPKSGQSQQIYEGEEVVGGLTLHHDGRLLLFLSGGAIRLWTPGESSMETLLDGIEGEEQSRFNDVVADPEGRVFAGTMPTDERPGRLYRFDPDGTLHQVLPQAGLPNGMGFSPDLSLFYFTDTDARVIDAFDYDRQTGVLSNRRTVFKCGEEPGNPDGLAIDHEGNLWSAFYGGHRLVCFSPQGEERARLDLPMAENPTCPWLMEGAIYLTTAGGGHRPQAGTAAGALLRINLPVQPGHSFCSGRAQ